MRVKHTWRSDRYGPTRFSLAPTAPRRKVRNHAHRSIALLLFVALFAFPVLSIHAGKTAGVALTADERAWLDQHPDELTLYFNVAFAPMEFMAPDGSFSGMGADVITMIEQRLGVQFKKNPSDDWNRSLLALKKGAFAIAPTIARNPDRERFAFFTTPYTTVPVVIISGPGERTDLTLDDFNGKRVAFVPGYGIEGYLKSLADKGFKAIPMPDVAHGLRATAFGQVDAFVENLAAAAYHIEKEGIPNLRVAGQTKERLPLSIGVSRNYPLLFSAIEKALAAIPPGQLEAIEKRWLSLEIGDGMAAGMLRMTEFLAVMFVLLLLGLAGVNYLLKRRLSEKVANLKKTQQMLMDQTELLQLATNATQAGIWESRPKMQTIYLSAQWYAMLGYAPQEKTIPISEHLLWVHPEDRPTVVRFFEDYIHSDGQGRYEVELRIRRADGTWCWVLSKAKAVEWNAEGVPTRITGLDVNIQSIKDAQTTTAQSEAKFRAIFDHAPYAIVINSLEDGTLMDANPAFLDSRGYTRDELPNIRSHDYATLEDNEVEAVLDTLMTEGAVKNREATVVRKDGTSAHVMYSSVVIEIGGRKQVLSMTVDVTERLQKETALKESMELLRATFNATTDGILVVNNDLKVIQANRQFYEMWRMPPELQKTDDDTTLRKFCQDQLADPAGFRDMIDRLYHSGIQDMFEIPLKDGRVFECYSAPMIMGGREIGRVWDFRDISERKQTEEELRVSENKLRSIFAAMTDVILVLDAQGRYLEIAATSAARLYRPPHELLGKTLDDVFPREKADGFLKAIHKTLSQRKTVSLDYELTIDTRRVWFAATLSPLSSDRVIWVARDITSRKRTEAERQKLQDQLHQSQKLEAVGVLAGGVAHDFNNMLGAIIGYAELALDELDSADPVRRNFISILDAARRSADLTRQLLAFARKQTVAPVVFDLNASVEGTLTMLRRLIGENIELAWRPTTGHCPVNMDPSQLDQILANLCVNARDAIADVGKITIKTDTAAFDKRSCSAHTDCVPGDYIRLSVNDNGCGMDRETLEHVFEPFFTTKGIGQGTGLGLATVYGIVKQNEGFIHLDSEPGIGTTFSIYLPRHAFNSVAESAATDHTIPRSQGETVLMVEDDPTLREMGQLMLQRLDYTVLSAATPGDAIRMARETQGDIQLLITDVVMPEMNGRELADRLRALRPDMRHLFMSGYTADIIARKGVLDEGVNFIQKPFSLKDLAEKIRAVLE